MSKEQIYKTLLQSGMTEAAVFGMTVMCLCDIMDDIDELAEMTAAEPEEPEEEELPGVPAWEEMD